MGNHTGYSKCSARAYNLLTSLLYMYTGLANRFHMMAGETTEIL